MKKALLLIITFACIVIAESAMAGTPKPPKILCYELTTNSYHQLVLKATGSIPTPDGTVKTYAITGHAFTDAHYPVSGSGYVVPGTATLHATFSSQFGLQFRWFGSYELIFDLETNSGTLHYRFDGSDGTTIQQGQAFVNSMDCKDPSLTINQ